MCRVVLPVPEPPLELLALNIFRNVHVDFLREPVYNAIRSNRLLKLYGELDPGTWQGHCFFFCIEDSNITGIFLCNCFRHKALDGFLVYAGNGVDVHLYPVLKSKAAHCDRDNNLLPIVPDFQHCNDAAVRFRAGGHRGGITSEIPSPCRISVRNRSGGRSICPGGGAAASRWSPGFRGCPGRQAPRSGGPFR